jgi:hypothetical protein
VRYPRRGELRALSAWALRARARAGAALAGQLIVRKRVRAAWLRMGLQALPMVLRAGLCVSGRAAERCQLSGASCRCAGDALGDQVSAASAAAARGAAQARAARGSDCAWHRAASQRKPMRCQLARAWTDRLA